MIVADLIRNCNGFPGVFKSSAGFPAGYVVVS